jgi:hypothetical protein
VAVPVGVVVPFGGVEGLTGSYDGDVCVVTLVWASSLETSAEGTCIQLRWLGIGLPCFARRPRRSSVESTI